MARKILKMFARYPSLIHKDEGTNYGVSFPDFPGCVTAGATLEEAYQLAEEALQFHIEGMLEEGLDLPNPTSLDDVVALGEQEGAVVVTMVRTRIPTRSRRINITIDEGLLKVIDAAAAARSMNRSAFLAEGARLLAETTRKPIRYDERLEHAVRTEVAEGRARYPSQKQRRRGVKPKGKTRT